MMILNFPSSNRVSDALAGADTTPCQVREAVENDKETLAMKKRDMPPPVPERVANPRVREDPSITRLSLKLRQDAPCYL